MEKYLHNSRYEKAEVFTLTPKDIESAVMQFICSCYPEYSTGHVVKVCGATECTAIVLKHLD